MLQFLFGLLAGLLVGLVMEWIVDWQALVPWLGFQARPSLDRVNSTGQSSSSHPSSPVASDPVEADSSAHRE